MYYKHAGSKLNIFPFQTRLLPLYNPWKHQKVTSFLLIAEGIEEIIDLKLVHNLHNHRNIQISIYTYNWQGFPNTIKGKDGNDPSPVGGMMRNFNWEEKFWFSWWKSKEEWFWPFEPFSKLKVTFKDISFRANNFIRNNTTRSLIIFGINKIEVSYRLTSNILALLSEILDDKQ